MARMGGGAVLQDDGHGMPGAGNQRQLWYLRRKSPAISELSTSNEMFNSRSIVESNEMDAATSMKWIQ
jgi:hypothetical protein